MKWWDARVQFVVFLGLTSLICHSAYAHGDDDDDDDIHDTRPTKSVKHDSDRIPPTNKEPQRLLVISLDGFRHDFLDLAEAKVLANFAKDGVRAKSLTASYVTKTFPNHHSIATGLYEESHGIIANQMYDPDLKENFNHCSDPSCGKWYGGEPIWNSNELNNPPNLRRMLRFRRHGEPHPKEPLIRSSGAIYWPGSSAQINGRNISYDLPYTSSQAEDYMTFRERLDMILSWFTDDEMPINLGMVYYESPDNLCHKYGPESLQVRTKIKEIGEDIDYLLHEMTERKLQDLNVIILSDHGFADFKGDVYLEDCISDVDKYAKNISNQAPIVYLYPETDAERDKLYDELKACDGLIVHKKDSEEMKSYHYSDNPRISPIIVFTKPAADNSSKLIKLHRSENWTLAGGHGWNNSWEKMHALFIAKGPAFKHDYVRDTFANIHVYPLMCEILSISCKKSNGSLEMVKDLLFEESDSSYVTMVTLVLSGVFCLLIAGIMVICGCRQHRTKHLPSYHSRTNPVFNMRSPGKLVPERSTLLDSTDEEF